MEVCFGVLNHFFLNSPEQEESSVTKVFMKLLKLLEWVKEIRMSEKIWYKELNNKEGCEGRTLTSSTVVMKDVNSVDPLMS